MINLLIVDDDATLSENIKEVLAGLGDITQVFTMAKKVCSRPKAGCTI